MLEIIIVWRLVVYIGREAAYKNLKKLRYQIMAVLLWITGESTGALIGITIFQQGNAFWPRYAVTLVGAAAGAGMAFLIMALIPKQNVVPTSVETGTVQAASGKPIFFRSAWVPVIAVLLCVSCLCLSLGGMVVTNVVRLAKTYATEPIIGIDIDQSGFVSQPLKEIPSDAERIYLGFYYQTAVGEVPATFDWYIDGKLAYSLKKSVQQGFFVIALDRKALGLSNFNKGNYEVKVHYGEMPITSATFVVK